MEDCGRGSAAGRFPCREGGAVVQPEVGEPGTAVQPPTPAFTVPHSKSLQGSPGTTPVA